MNFIDNKVDVLEDAFIDDNNEIEDNTYCDDSVKAYLNEIRKIPLLTHSEEKELFNQYRINHDKQIFNRICESNLKLVVSIALKYNRTFKDANFNVSLLDLIQDGNLGLMYAIDGFEYGEHFSTYATYCIKSFILRGIYNKAFLIRIPVHLMEKKIKIDRAINEYINANAGKSPTIEELTFMTDLKESDIERCLQYNNSIISLNSPIEEDDDDCLEDTIASSFNTEEQAIEAYIKDYIIDILDKLLNERSSDIVKLRYGIEDGTEQTFDEISKKYGVTRMRIKQINCQSLCRLGESTKIKKLRKDFF